MKGLPALERQSYGLSAARIWFKSQVPIHFVIADGIVAMEGNGPLNRVPRALGKIVLADDPVAADNTCVRLMGLDPERVAHLHEGARFLGNTCLSLIDQVGEPIDVHPNPFLVVQEFRHLYM